MQLLALGGLVVLLTSGCVQHIASDRIAVVFGNPITYGEVEWKLLNLDPATLRSLRLRSLMPIGAEMMSDRAKRCGWSEDDLELWRFRTLFLSKFMQEYSSRIGASNARRDHPIHSSRIPTRSMSRGYISSTPIILIEHPDDPQGVAIGLGPDYASWKVRQTLFVKHGGRVSKRQGWSPVDALRKEVELFELSGEIKFFDADYRKRLWRYFDDFGERNFVSLQESEEYFRIPWWSKPLAPERTRLMELKHSPLPSPCTPL